MTDDHQLAALTLCTATAPPFVLEVETAELDTLIAQLLAIAHRAGDGLDANPVPTAGSPVNAVPIATNGIGVMLGPAGHTLLVARVGCIDLAMQIENSEIGPIGRELVALSIQLAAEPIRAQ